MKVYIDTGVFIDYLFGAEVLITVDEDILQLDGVIANRSGTLIKFCDTDVALTIL